MDNLILMFEGQGEDLELRKPERKRQLQHAKHSYHLQQLIIFKCIYFPNILLVV